MAENIEDKGLPEEPKNSVNPEEGNSSLPEKVPEAEEMKLEETLGSLDNQIERSESISSISAFGDMKIEEIEAIAGVLYDVKSEIQKVVIGQEETLDLLMVGLFTGGNILLEGVPGIAKTLLAKMLAKSLKTEFVRIQFTPCLLYTSPSPRDRQKSRMPSSA